MRPSKALAALMRGEDVLIDGVRYRLVGDRVSVIIGERAFRSDLTVDALLRAEIHPARTEGGE